MLKKDNSDFVATKIEKTFDDEGNTQVADVKHLEDQFLLKKLQNTGGNIRKSKLLNKSIKKTLGKKDKFKKDRQIMAKQKFTHFVPREKPKKRIGTHTKSLNKSKKRTFKKYNRQGR